jgi:hypothetical protein
MLSQARRLQPVPIHTIRQIRQDGSTFVSYTCH